MPVILSINSTPILNFTELQREFSPTELYKNAEVFCAFSQVHCLQYLSKMTDSEGFRFDTVIFRKDVWQSVLEEVTLNGDKSNTYPFEVLEEMLIKRFCEHAVDDTAVTHLINSADETRNKSITVADDAFVNLVREIREFHQKNGKTQDATGSADIEKTAKGILRAQLRLFVHEMICHNNRISLPQWCTVQEKKLQLFEQEYRYFEITSKIAFLKEKCKNDADKAKRIVSILAICELAEVSPQSAWTDDAPDEKASQTVTPTDFDYQRDVSLPCSRLPKRYLVCSDACPQGDFKIYTVKLTARPSDDAHKLTLEFFSEGEQKLIQRVELSAGDSVYINAVNNRVAKVLPEIYTSDDMCLIRRGDDLWVYSAQQAAWNAAPHGACLAATGNSNQGFLVLSDGRVRAHGAGYTTEAKVQMLRDAVDMKKANRGFDILQSDGTVVNTLDDAVMCKAVRLGAATEASAWSVPCNLKTDDRFGRFLIALKDKFPELE